MKNGIPTGAVAAMVLAVCGCSSASRTPSRPVYDPRQTGTIMSVQKAEVIAVRDVDIKATTPVGSTGTVGAVTGGAVESVISGSTRAIGRVVGAVVGGAVGSQADATTGEELTLSVEGGRTIIVVQERTDPPLAPGEKVLVVTSTGGSPSIYGVGRVGTIGLPPVGGNTRVVREEHYVAAIDVTRLEREAALAQVRDSSLSR